MTKHLIPEYIDAEMSRALDSLARALTGPLDDAPRHIRAAAERLELLRVAVSEGKRP